MAATTYSPHRVSALPLIPVGRKSSGEDPELSRARQEGATQRWAEAEGEKLAPFVWEAHVSGSKHWRERGLGAAIAAVERGEAAGIVVEEQSRLSREDMLATAEVWEALERAGARLVCTAEGIDTAKGDHELSFAIRAALAREQWKQYARRMEAMKSNRIDQGIFIGTPPFGYVKNDEKRLEIDPAAAPIVVELFERRAAGAGWRALAAWLDEAVQKLPTSHRFHPSVRPSWDHRGGGASWSRQGVSGIIRNRVYLGELVYGDLVNEQAHEAIVDAPLWHAAQRRGKAHERAGRKSDRWLLSGLVVCGSCGRAMIVWTGSARQQKNPSRAYKCNCRACPNPMRANAKVLEPWAVDTLWTLLGAKIASHAPETDLTPLVEAAAKAEARLEQALAPEAQDALGDRWAAAVKERRQAHEDALEALGEARQAAGAQEVNVLDMRDSWDELSPAERREVLATYAIDRIIIHGREPSKWEMVLL